MAELYTLTVLGSSSLSQPPYSDWVQVSPRPAATSDGIVDTVYHVPEYWNGIIHIHLIRRSQVRFPTLEVRQLLVRDMWLWVSS